MSPAVGLSLAAGAVAILANACAIVAIAQTRHGRRHVAWSAVALLLCGVVVGLAVGVLALIRWGRP